MSEFIPEPNAPQGQIQEGFYHTHDGVNSPRVTQIYGQFLFESGTATDAPTDVPSNLRNSIILKDDGTNVRLWAYINNVWKSFTPSNELVDVLTKTKGNLIAGNGSAFIVLGVGANGTILTADSGEATGLRWAASTSPDIDRFGDGSDGDVTISANTTLTKDMFYNNLTINSGKVLTTAGYRIFCKGTLTNNGTIRWNGGNGTGGGNAVNSGIGGPGAIGTGGAGGAGLTSVVLYGSPDGTAGSNGAVGVAANQGVNSPGNKGVNGSAGTTLSYGMGAVGAVGAVGGHGGNAGGGNGSGAGGDAGAAGTYALSKSQPLSLAGWQLMRDLMDITKQLQGEGSNGGSSGGGSGGAWSNGAGDYSCSGSAGGAGGAGSNGGVIAIYAKTLTNNGTIESNGGSGGNGGNGGNAWYQNNANAGGGGGGAGGDAGNGGVILLVYETITLGTVQCLAGSVGTGGTFGTAANGGSDGVAGANGGAGNAGTILQINL